MENPPPDPTPEQAQRRLGARMIVVAWILVLATLTLALGAWVERRADPVRLTEGRTGPEGVPEVRVRKGPGGHYVAAGAINGIPVRFLLDTGASDVSVPGRLARSLGLREGVPLRLRTAGGDITARATRLDRVSLGPIELRDVRAHINPRMEGEEVLLGMSALARLEFEQRGEQMTLRPR